jgi:hypothetical protein
LSFKLHPKQLVAFRSKAEILYRGAAGGGKPDLMRAAAISGCSVIAGLQVYLFRPISKSPKMIAPSRSGGPRCLDLHRRTIPSALGEH